MAMNCDSENLQWQRPPGFEPFRIDAAFHPFLQRQTCTRCAKLVMEMPLELMLARP